MFLLMCQDTVRMPRADKRPMKAIPIFIVTGSAVHVFVFGQTFISAPHQGVRETQEHAFICAYLYEVYRAARSFARVSIAFAFP